MENEPKDLESGVVKVYYPLKGFGFITRQKGKDLFFHRSDMKEEAWAFEGAHVTYSIAKREKGLQAVDIKRVG